MYTLAAVLLYIGGTYRPVPIVVPNLTYQSCNNLISSFKTDSQLSILGAHCEVQAEEKNK